MISQNIPRPDPRLFGSFTSDHRAAISPPRSQTDTPIATTRIPATAATRWIPRAPAVNVSVGHAVGQRCKQKCNEGSTLHCEHDSHHAQQSNGASQRNIGIHRLHEGKPQQWIGGVKNDVRIIPALALIAKLIPANPKSAFLRYNDKSHNGSSYGYLPAVRFPSTTKE